MCALQQLGRERAGEWNCATRFLKVAFDDGWEEEHSNCKYFLEAFNIVHGIFSCMLTLEPLDKEALIVDECLDSSFGLKQSNESIS